MAFDSVTALSAALEARELSAVDATRAAFARIAETGERTGAWLALDEDGALAAAARVDDKRAAGQPLGPLAGVPVGVKDMICTRGVATTAASRILKGFVPPYDATVVAKLRAADAVILGKLNQDEFAMGSSNENSAFGPARNPWDLAKVPGGSSGGSAAAVAAGDCLLTLGTDTGGSIRQPASFCGVVGVKPTYGRVSRYGVVAFASSLDQVGPLARSAEDAALLLEVLSGHDPLDSTSIPREVPSYRRQLAGGVRGLRVGIPREYFPDGGVDADVKDRVQAAIDELESLGAELVDISLPHTEYAVATYYVLATAEAASNLARYDGVRYGHRAADPRDLEDLYSRSRAEGFGPEVKRRILLGTYVLSSGYYDAYYLKAQRVRTLIKRDFERAFEACDLICAPASPTTAIGLGDKADDPLQMYLMDIFTIPASLAGLPCASIPAGRDSAGLPVGLQIIAPPLEEGRLLRAAHTFQQATGWHLERPAGFGG